MAGCGRELGKEEVHSEMIQGSCRMWETCGRPRKQEISDKQTW